MNEHPPRYLSFLLRLWRVKDRQGWNWRASLEHPLTQRRRGFSDLICLFEFLQRQMNGESFEEIYQSDEDGSDFNLDQYSTVEPLEE